MEKVKAIFEEAVKLKQDEMNYLVEVSKKALGINPDALNVFVKNNENNKKYYFDFQTKLYMLKKSYIEKYNLDLNTYFEIQAIYEKNIYILEKGNYKHCLDYFDEYYPLDEIKDIFSLNENDKFEIRLVDNKNNYNDILFSNL